MAYRKAIDAYRRRGKPTLSVEDQEHQLQVADPTDRSGQNRMEAEDRQQQIQWAIRQLKPQDATIIRLFYMEDCTVEDIAGITGLTVTNVKTRLHRQRQRLRKMLASMEE